MCKADSLIAMSLVGFAITLPLSASAQTREAGAPQIAADRSSAGTSSSEIIVTAQKTGEQRLLNTQIAITAFSGAQIDRTPQTRLQDVLAATPGLSVTTQGVEGVAQYQIRGGSGTVGDPTVGVYFDDLPFSLLTFTYVPEVDPFDLQRVEVLRGPQGTLYGAASEGGTVRILTNNASTTKFEVKGAGQVGFQKGSDVEYRTVGTVNVPLVKDLLGVRVSGGYRYAPGYLSDRTGNQNYNHSGNWFVRAKATLTPASNLEIRGMAWLQRSRAFASGSNADYVAPEPGPLFYPALPASSLITGKQAIINNTFDLYNAAVEWSPGPVRIYSTTSHIRYALDQADGIYQDTSQTRLTSWSNETRLSSNYTSILQWNVGTFYNSISQRGRLQAAALGIPDNLELRDSRQLAGFGEVHLKPLGEKLEFTGGLRYFDDRRSFETPILLIATGLPIPPSLNFPVAYKQANFHKLTYRGNIAYRSNGSLIYANISSGFRSGGFNFGSTLALAPPGSVPTTYRPEDVTAYEIGGKSYFLHKKLTAEIALYLNDYNSLIFNSLTSSGFASFANIGRARALGIDWNLNFRATSELSFQLGGNLNDSTYRQNEPSVGVRRGDRISYVPTAQLIGSVAYRHRLGGDLSLFGNADFVHNSARRDYGALAAFGPSGLVFNRVTSSGSAIDSLNLRAGVDAAGWSLFAYTNNALDERGVITANAVGDASLQASGLATDVHPRPRVIGIGGTFSF